MRAAKADILFNEDNSLNLLSLPLSLELYIYTSLLQLGGKLLPVRTLR